MPEWKKINSLATLMLRNSIIDNENLNYDFPSDDGGESNLMFAFFVREAAEHVVPALMELYVETAQSNPKVANPRNQKRVVEDILFFVQNIAEGLSELVGDEEQDHDE